MTIQILLIDSPFGYFPTSCSMQARYWAWRLVANLGGQVHASSSISFFFFFFFFSLCLSLCFSFVSFFVSICLFHFYLFLFVFCLFVSAFVSFFSFLAGLVTKRGREEGMDKINANESMRINVKQGESMQINAT